MCLITKDCYEHLIDGVAVSHKVIKFCGISLFTVHMESTNCNWTSQFDADNFITNKQDDDNQASIYTETNIGFKNDKENTETTVQPEGISRKS